MKFIPGFKIILHLGYPVAHMRPSVIVLSFGAHAPAYNELITWLLRASNAAMLLSRVTAGICAHRAMAIHL